MLNPCCQEQAAERPGLLTGLPTGRSVHGNSLSLLQADVAELSELCASGDLVEANKAASRLLADMDLPLQRYTEALRFDHIRLPF